jgi:hypothetical protein
MILIKSSFMALASVDMLPPLSRLRHQVQQLLQSSLKRLSIHE